MSAFWDKVWAWAATPRPDTDVSRAEDLPGDVQAESQEAFDEATDAEARTKLH